MPDGVTWKWAAIAVAIVLAGLCTPATVWAAILLAGIETGNEVDPRFYMAISAVIPLLLLALLTRYGRLRSDVARIELGAIEERLASTQKNLEEVTAIQRDAIREGADPEMFARISRVREEIESRLAEHRGLERVVGNARWYERSTQALMVWLVVVTTLLAAVAEGAALAALAFDERTFAVFVLTATGAVWLVIAVLIMEVREALG